MSFNTETGMYEGYIYCITNKINGKQYIGQTTRTIEKRWKEHVYDSKTNKRNYIFYNALNKYGVSNFITVEILKTCDSSKRNLFASLNKLEIEYISKFNSLKPYGYNSTSGGKNITNAIVRKVNQYDLKGNFINSYDSITDASNILDICYGGIINVCSYRSSSCGGYLWCYSDIKFNINNYPNNNNMKSVVQYDISGKLINSFLSLTDASNFINGNEPAISNVCNGKLNTYKNYIWRYEGDDFYKYIPKGRYQRIINQLDTGGNILKTFQSIKSASKEYNISSGNIIACCKGFQKTAGGYIWKYADEVSIQISA